jgi:hypothetical protein
VKARLPYKVCLQLEVTCPVKLGLEVSRSLTLVLSGFSKGTDSILESFLLKKLDDR